MTNLEKDFLILTKNCIIDENVKISSSLKDLEQLALSHICVPFIYRGALNAGVDVPETWKQHMTVSAFRNLQNLQVQSMILKTLNDADIPCSVIKGSTVSVNYKEPMLRTLGDVDILVNVSDYERAIDVLCGDDYEDESCEDHQFHYKYTIQGVAVEIHKYVTEYSNDEYGQRIKAFMDDALENVILKQIDEFLFPSLTNEYQAATLLLHTQRHFFENRLPIRMLCDWAMFASSINREEWEGIVYPFISEMGLSALCDALCATCNSYLGTDIVYDFKNEIDKKTVDILIEEFLNCGVIKDNDSWSENMASNFSQKRSNSKGGKIVSLFKILNDLARHDFKLANKSAIFLPFCWVAIMVRYLHKRITGKRSKFSFTAFNSTAERKGLLIDKLNLKD